MRCVLRWSCLGSPACCTGRRGPSPMMACGRPGGMPTHTSPQVGGGPLEGLCGLHQEPAFCGCSGMQGVAFGCAAPPHSPRPCLGSATAAAVLPAMQATSFPLPPPDLVYLPPADPSSPPPLLQGLTLVCGRTAPRCRTSSSRCWGSAGPPTSSCARWRCDPWLTPHPAGEGQGSARHAAGKYAPLGMHICIRQMSCCTGYQPCTAPPPPPAIPCCWLPTA